MFKSALHNTPRQALRLQNVSRASRISHFLSTAPPAKKSRSWKGSALRWGLAGGAVYYYNTNSLFAEQPEAAIHRLDGSIHRIQDSEAPTLEAIEQERRLRREEIRRQELEKKNELEGKTPLAEEEQAIREHDGDEDGSLEGLEDEADQQGAFNPETGEINWDCPCLGGMAHGPCGDEFRAAFSCFVYSKEEPKGMECIDKFKGMQDCFRAHPEHYASELEEDEVEDEIEQQREPKSADIKPASSSDETDADKLQLSEAPSPKPSSKEPAASASPRETIPKSSADNKGNGDEGGQLIPRDMATESSASK